MQIIQSYLWPINTAMGLGYGDTAKQSSSFLASNIMANWHVSDLEIMIIGIQGYNGSVTVSSVTESNVNWQYITSNVFAFGSSSLVEYNDLEMWAGICSGVVTGNITINFDSLNFTKYYYNQASLTFLEISGVSANNASSLLDTYTSHAETNLPNHAATTGETSETKNANDFIIGALFTFDADGGVIDNGIAFQNNTSYGFNEFYNQHYITDNSAYTYSLDILWKKVTYNDFMIGGNSFTDSNSHPYTGLIACFGSTSTNSQLTYTLTPNANSIENNINASFGYYDLWSLNLQKYYTYNGLWYQNGTLSGNGYFTVSTGGLMLSPFTVPPSGYTLSLNITFQNGQLSFTINPRAYLGYEDFNLTICINATFYSFIYQVQWITGSGTTPTTPTGTVSTDPLTNFIILFLIFFVPALLLTMYFGKSGFFVGLMLSTAICVLSNLIPVWFLFIIGICLIYLILTNSPIGDWVGVRHSG